jgi:two-component system, sensor histidine kinase and response regulator
VVNRVFATNLLEKRGHNVRHAENGNQAVTAATSEEFDLILMDVQMPDLDGLGATAAIRKWEAQAGRRTPIVAMTAHAMAGDRERCIEGGMDDHISKPIDKNQLVKLIARIASEKEGSAVRANQADSTVISAAVKLTVESPSTLSRSELLNRLDDDEELMHRIIALFRENTPRIIEKIRESIQQRNSSDIARSAHALIGSLTTVGAREASRLSTLLESAAARDDYAAIHWKFEALERETSKVHHALSSFVASRS